MANSDVKTMQTLNITLNSMTDLPDKVFYGRYAGSEEVDASDTYISTYNMTSDSDAPVVSGGDYERDTGIYQASIFVPVDANSEYNLSILVDKIKSVFPRNTPLQSGESKLTIRKITVPNYVIDGSHAMRAVSVYWSVLG